MKYTLTFIALLICKFCFSQQMSYQDWQEQAKSDIRLIPEYGHLPKTKEQIETDEELIKTSLKADTTHRKFN